MRKREKKLEKEKIKGIFFFFLLWNRVENKRELKITQRQHLESFQQYNGKKI